MDAKNQIGENAKRMARVFLLITCLWIGGELRAQNSLNQVKVTSVNESSTGRTEVIIAERTQRVKFQFNFVGGSSDLVMQYRGNDKQAQEFDNWVKNVAASSQATIDTIIIQTYYSKDETMGSTELAQARIAEIESYVRNSLKENGFRKSVPLKAHIRVSKDDESAGSFAVSEYDRLRQVDVILSMNSAGEYSPVTDMSMKRGVAVTDAISPGQRSRQQMAAKTNAYPVWIPEPGKKTRKRQSKSTYQDMFSMNDKPQSSYNSQMFVPGKKPYGVDQVFSIKTNIPYWAALTPNVGFEFYMGHFSIALEGLWSFWEKKNDTGDKGIYIAGGGPEFRYWLNDDRSKGSHFFGIYGQYYDYDVKLNETGRQGDGWGGGFSYGYYLPVGNRWAFEFGIGIGALRLKYDIYDWDHDISRNVWRKEKSETWIGPTKLKASVIFRIGNK